MRIQPRSFFLFGRRIVPMHTKKLRWRASQVAGLKSVPVQSWTLILTALRSRIASASSLITVEARSAAETRIVQGTSRYKILVGGGELQRHERSGFRGT
jgi:hypothetical protein